MGIIEAELIVKVTMDRIMGRTIFVLHEDLVFILDGVEYRIEKGFTTDFMSMPFLVKGLLDVSRGAKAAVLHDMLLRRGTPHKEANRIFHRAMKVLGMGRVEMFLIGIGVRVNSIFKDIFGIHIDG